MSRVFVDTNTLVYVDQAESAFHVRARAALGSLEAEGAELWISRQVLREYLAAVARPGRTGAAPMTRAEAATATEGFVTAYHMAEDGADATYQLPDLVRRVPRGGKQVHDANIVATMLAHRISRPLTFNLPDFRRFAGLIELVIP